MVFLGQLEAKVLEIVGWEEDVIEKDDEQDGQGIEYI
jgi:hypothetical protein